MKTPKLKRKLKPVNQYRAEIAQEINAARIQHTQKAPMNHDDREALADGMFEQKYCVDLDDKTLLQRILLHQNNSKLSFRLK